MDWSDWMIVGLVLFSIIQSLRISGLSGRVTEAINEARSAKEALVLEQTSHAQMVDSHEDEIRRLRAQFDEFNGASGTDARSHHT
jgi:hypothetical protein